MMMRIIRKRYTSTKCLMVAICVNLRTWRRGELHRRRWQSLSRWTERFGDCIRRSSAVRRSHSCSQARRQVSVSCPHAHLCASVSRQESSSCLFVVCCLVMPTPNHPIIRAPEYTKCTSRIRAVLQAGTLNGPLVYEQGR